LTQGQGPPPVRLWSLLLKHKFPAETTVMGYLLTEELHSLYLELHRLHTLHHGRVKEGWKRFPGVDLRQTFGLANAHPYGC
jgi:hypothetical protein